MRHLSDRAVRTPPTRPQLLAIESTGPVQVTERGQGHQGVRWVVDPANFPTLIQFINTHGGPGMWSVKPTGEKQ